MDSGIGVQRVPSQGEIKHITYERTHQIVKSFEQDLAEKNFDLIVGVARSGIVPAAMISQIIDVPVAFLQYSRTDPEPRFLTPTPINGKKILIVDDLIGLGITMQTVVDFVKTLGAAPYTFCLFYDSDTTTFRPDFGFPTSHFIHFQWDRKEVTPKSIELRKSSNGRMGPKEFKECLGTDLDGIFLNDVNAKTYRPEERIPSVLSYRDSLQPLENIPITDHKDIYVITARPEMDYERTRKWLDKNGFTKVQLICRNQSEYKFGLKEAARFKADQILKIGISKYFESDLMQAVIISKMTPCTDIYWWGKEDKLRIYTNPVTNRFMP